MREISVVTGASSGLGRAMAIELAKEGGKRLLLLARNEAPLHVVAGEVHQVGGLVSVSRVDVRNAPALRRIFWKLQDDGMGVTELIHCAGVLYPGDQEQVSPAHAKEMNDTNAEGTYNVLEAAERTFFGRGGQVAVVSSIAAKLVLPPGIGAYTESKVSQARIAEAKRRALGIRGASLTIAYPGIIDTPMVRGRELELPDWYQAFPWASPLAVARQILADMRVGERESYYPRWHRQGSVLAKRFPRLWRVALNFTTRRRKPLPVPA